MRRDERYVPFKKYVEVTGKIPSLLQHSKLVKMEVDFGGKLVCEAIEFLAKEPTKRVCIKQLENTLKERNSKKTTVETVEQYSIESKKVEVKSTKNMTVDEAIKHYQKIIEENKNICEECVSEHIQLITWLEELKELREFKTKVARAFQK